MVRTHHHNGKRRICRAVGAAMCLLLGACDNPWMEDAPSLDEVLSRGWLFGDAQSDAAEMAPMPLYCYETLGVGDCYDEPLADGGNRLIGFEGPAPIAIQP